MPFLDFFTSVFDLFGSGGVLVVAVFAIIIDINKKPANAKDKNTIKHNI
jgi:hypothetical protein